MLLWVFGTVKNTDNVLHLLFKTELELVVLTFTPCLYAF